MKVWALLLSGCTADLLPGEQVLGAERAATRIVGEDGDALGSAVAVAADASLVLVGAPGAGRVLGVDRDGAVAWEVSGVPGLGRRVGWTAAGEPWAWAPGDGIYGLGPEGAERWLDAAGAEAVDLCPDGSLVTRAGPGEAIACAEAGLIFTECDADRCAVWRAAWPVTGEVERLSALGSPGSAVAWLDAGEGPVACWGDAALTQPEASGSVRCEDGRLLEGDPGDHLGLAIGGGRAAGVFAEHRRPRRARVLALAEGEAWVVERASIGSRVALHGAGDLVAVGVGGYPGQAPAAGLVYLVQEEVSR